ncbi:MAG: isocitrate/isopropylmalate dehydrogenase family protein [Clostridia bacterium]|nr:isocitrate/isopropylmalate dehydrogenase family protein [Clostridia bacterium]
MQGYIDSAVEKFRELLTEQLARSERIAKGGKAKDFTKMGKIVIGVCGGDGIGPIITREGERVLRYLLKDEIEKGSIEIRTIDGLTLEKRQELGEAIPADTLLALKECDVILKGPTTTPHGGNLESANVAMRRELDLYANVRPVNVPEENIDWIFYRENSEGEYVLGSRGVEIPEKLAVDFKVTTDAGTRRIARAAFEYAKNNGKTNVAIVTKANIMKKTDGNFSKICHEVAAEYPDITAEDWYVDIMTANLINEAIRSKFQVFVLPNLYGDIITDEAAQIQGGVGTAGSANVGDAYAMFEAVHGSAPRLIEQGLGEYANPSSIFKAAAMMLRHIARTSAAEKLEKALLICTETEKKVIATGEAENATCAEFSDYVMETIQKMDG